MDNTMHTILLVIYLIASAGVIGLVLIQHGKGADMGASFGAGASNTVFGSGGSGNFLTRMTALCAVVFFAVSLALGNMATHTSGGFDLKLDENQPTVEAQDAADTVSSESTTDVPASTESKQDDVPL